MRWIFGPVPSRRFGRSLGIDLFSRKTCSFDCVYCEVGPTLHTTAREDRAGGQGEDTTGPSDAPPLGPNPFAPVDEVLGELRAYLADHHDDLPDFITFAGSGEPTLHKGLGQLVAGIKAMTTVPVVLLTNASLLHRPAVLQRALGVDYLVPSLDAGCAATFQRVNRPARSLTFDQLTRGLLDARAAFHGHYLLEVLLVQDVNTSDEEFARLKTWIDRIQPDAVQVNTVFRPPAEHDAHPATQERIDRFVELVGPLAQPVAYYDRTSGHPQVVRHIQGELLEQVILKTVGIRPCTVAEMTHSVGATPQAMTAALDHLRAQGAIREILHNGEVHIAEAPTRARA